MTSAVDSVANSQPHLAWVQASGPRLRRAIQMMCVLFGMIYAAGFTAATTKFDTAMQVADYERIHLIGNAQLVLVQENGSSASAPDGGVSEVSVSGAPHSLRKLVIESSDGVLYIDAGDNQSIADVLIYLTVKELKELFSQGQSVVEADSLIGESLFIESRGGGHIDIARLDVADLTVVGAGASRFSVSGAVENQYVDLQGLGVYQAQGLASQTSQVNVYGSSEVELWVEELLDVNVFGSAKVSYSGRPWVQQHMFGKGAIRRLGE